MKISSNITRYPSVVIVINSREADSSGKTESCSLLVLEHFEGILAKTPRPLWTGKRIVDFPSSMTDISDTAEGHDKSQDRPTIA